MFIDRIQLRGFKSFKSADIYFSKGFVCLTGPNGSGKSNICDGIRFAIGTSSLKSLRAKKVADLIMFGRDKAEISILLNGGKELEIKRAIRSDGKTLYRVNGKRMSRGEALGILQSFSIEPDGHNVIAQGEVERIAEMSPKERREVIEKVSGIAEFDEKKEEALKELSKVENKINDVRIVLKERESYLRDLEKERNDALLHMELKGCIHTYRGSLIFLELKRVDEEHSSALEKYMKLKSEEEELKKKINELDIQLNELSEKKGEIVQNINEQSGRERSLREIEELRSLIGISANSKEEKGREVKRIEQRMNTIMTERKTLCSRITEINEEVERSRKEMEELTKQLDFYEKTKNELDEKKEKLEKVERELLTKKELKSIREMELERIGEGIEFKEDERKEQIKIEIERLRELHSELADSISTLFENEKELNKTVFEAEKELLTKKEKYVSANAKIQENLIPKGVKFVMELQKRKSIEGVYGRVIDLCSFDEKYAYPIEVAAGQRMNYFVVNDVDTAANVIEELKKAKSGRCTFIPIDRKGANNEKKEYKEIKGAKGFLIDFVRFDERYRSAFEYVFGNILLVENIETAKPLIGKVRMVTMDGELIEVSGVLTGGFQPSFLKEKKNVERLKEEVEELKAHREKVVEELHKIREEMSKKRKDKAEIEIKIKEKELELGHIEEKESREKSARTKMEKTAESLRKEIESYHEEIKEKEREKVELSKDIKEVPDLCMKINNLRSGYLSLNGKLESKNTERNLLENRVSQIEKEMENLKSDLAQLNNEIKELNDKIKYGEKELKEKEEKMKGICSALEKLFAERDALEKKIEKLANEKGKIRYKYEILSRELREMEIKKVTSETRLADLKAEYSAYSDISPIEEEKEEIEKKIMEMEEKLAQLGMVNLLAPEMYEEKKKDIEEIKEKVGKLDEERKAIIKMIEEIEAKKTDIFMETFHALNENFKRLFSYIFKDEGFLVLNKPAEPFESGLTIKIRGEKGEKLLESMSGGEKSLITLIFIFAIHLHKPAPFYILDEVESALDEENSKKLANLLEKLSKNTQFIVVTHNDTILSAADSVIGVTMTKEGSKTVGVELASA